MDFYSGFDLPDFEEACEKVTEVEILCQGK
jgi:hypothetical protein